MMDNGSGNVLRASAATYAWETDIEYYELTIENLGV
jgi:hypothetical protein